MANLNQPYKHAVLITPNDAAPLAHSIRGISFSTAGTLKVTTNGGETITIPSGSLATGVIHPLEVAQVFATGTTATNIVGYY